MTLLAPLYALGAFALVAPILAHLIRRQPRGSRPFSSLMFLQPTPPRLTRRSRLDQWPLLLLRCLILLLIAIAFTRPLWRHAASTDEWVSPRHIVIAIDTSASMRDANVWADAIAHAQSRIAALDPDDHVGLVTFDREARVTVNLSDTRSGSESQNLVLATINSLSPSWERTDLSDALSMALECFAGTANEEATSNRKQVILISDMADAALTERVASIAWPEEIPVDVYRPQTTAIGNAFVEILPDESPLEREGELENTIRVRVTQNQASEWDQLTLGWQGVEISLNEQPEPWQSFQLPAGQSRILRVPLPGTNDEKTDSNLSAPTGSILALSGDATLFDNQTFVCQTPPLPQQIHVLTDAAPDDTKSSLYYLQNVPLDTASRTISIKVMPREETAAARELPLSVKVAPLVVFERPLLEQETKQLQGYLESGGRVLALLSSERDAAAVIESVNALSRLADENSSELTVTEADRSDYALLSGLDYQSQLLGPFAGPQYSDFSKIRFWSHRQIENVDTPWHSLAEFDSGGNAKTDSKPAPALIQRRLGNGTLWVMSAGWQPTASQLALSSKFVPLVLGFVGPPPAMDSRGLEVGDPVPGSDADGMQVVSVDGDVLTSSIDGRAITIESPGFYRMVNRESSTETDGAAERWFAVNVATSESESETIDNAVLERAGIALGNLPDAKALADQQRQLRDRELEQAQRLWQGLLLAALLLVALEAYWSMRCVTSQTAMAQSTMDSKTMEPTT